MEMICNAIRRTRCEGLRVSVERGGIEAPITFDRESGQQVKFQHGVYLEPIEKRGKKGFIFLNYCPFCGQQLILDRRAKTDSPMTAKSLK